MKVIYCLLFGMLFANTLCAQQPNPAYRLPVTPDMPEWAKQLYCNDIEVNVFKLDEAYEAWEAEYEAEHEDEEQEEKEKWESKGLTAENLWEEYYTRWRARVNPYVQEDGSLDFSIKTDRDFEWPQNHAEKISTSNWSYLGPVQTHWTKNDNSAQPLSPWQANIYSIDVAPSDAKFLNRVYGSMPKRRILTKHCRRLQYLNPSRTMRRRSCLCRH